VAPIKGDPLAEEDLVLLALAMIDRGFQDEQMLSQLTHFRPESSINEISRAIDEAKSRTWKPESSA